MWVEPHLSLLERWFLSNVWPWNSEHPLVHKEYTNINGTSANITVFQNQGMSAELFERDDSGVCTKAVFPGGVPRNLSEFEKKKKQAPNLKKNKNKTVFFGWVLFEWQEVWFRSAMWSSEHRVLRPLCGENSCERDLAEERDAEDLALRGGIQSSGQLAVAQSEYRHSLTPAEDFCLTSAHPDSPALPLCSSSHLPRSSAALPLLDLHFDFYKNPLTSFAFGVLKSFQEVMHVWNIHIYETEKRSAISPLHLCFCVNPSLKTWQQARWRAWTPPWPTLCRYAAWTTVSAHSARGAAPTMSPQVGPLSARSRMWFQQTLAVWLPVPSQNWRQRLTSMSLKMLTLQRCKAVAGSPWCGRCATRTRLHVCCFSVLIWACGLVCFQKCARRLPGDHQQSLRRSPQGGVQDHGA